MVNATLQIEKFGKNGEKTGWTYVFVDAKIAHKLNPGVKRSYRVKGKIDAVSVSQLALIPMGEGDFIIPLNAELRRKLKKVKGEKVKLSIELDSSEFMLSSDFMECLKEEPESYEFFGSLTPGHQNYFSKWIDSAKTIETKSKRIAQAMEGLKLKMGYPEMIRYHKAKKTI